MVASPDDPRHSRPRRGPSRPDRGPCPKRAAAGAPRCGSRSHHIRRRSPRPRRLARNLSGSVSFHSEGQNQWTTAAQNYPVASGDAVWTQPQAGASIMVDSSRIALAGGTELTVQEIDQTTITAALSQGEVFLGIAALQPGQSVTIATPRGTAQITANGEYALYAGDSTTPTYVTAVTGSIQFTGLGASGPQTVGAQQTLVVSGTNPVQAQLGAIQQDQFLTSMLQQIAPPPPPTTAQAPAVCAQMTGAATLAQYGAWQAQPNVGTVWFPQVAASWVPYRDGRWAYVEPWGWTWVDNEPWGFAPFHYGRWAQFGGRWGWVPAPVAESGYGYGPAYQPVYAPALVTFLGAAIGAVTAAAIVSGTVGWAPLGIHDPYYPPYPVSPRYFGAYNRAYVPNYNQFYQRNVTVMSNRVSYRNATINNFGRGSTPNPGVFNRAGATFVPREAMLGSQPIAAAARPLPPNAHVEPFRPGGAAGIQGIPRPTAGTWGVTPAFAQRARLAAAPAGTAPRVGAPGPAIRPVAAEAAGRRVPPPLVPHAAVAPAFRGGAAGEPGRAVPTQPGVRRGAAALAARPSAANPAGGLRPGGPGGAVAPRPQFPRPGVAPRPAAVAPRAPTPRVETPRVQAPRIQSPRPAPRVEAPRMEAPRIEAPRMEAPRAAPRMEAPRAAAPRGPERPPQR